MLVLIARATNARVLHVQGLQEQNLSRMNKDDKQGMRGLGWPMESAERSAKHEVRRGEVPLTPYNTGGLKSKSGKQHAPQVCVYISCVYNTYIYIYICECMYMYTYVYICIHIFFFCIHSALVGPHGPSLTVKVQDPLFQTARWGDNLVRLALSGVPLVRRSAPLPVFLKLSTVFRAIPALWL